MNRQVATWLVAMFPLAMASAAHGETLRPALIHAYRQTPSLTAARARRRPTDDGLPIDTAADRPTLPAAASYQEYEVRASRRISLPLRATNGKANHFFQLLTRH